MKIAITVAAVLIASSAYAQDDWIFHSQKDRITDEVVEIMAKFSEDGCNKKAVMLFTCKNGETSFLVDHGCFAPANKSFGEISVISRLDKEKPIKDSHKVGAAKNSFFEQSNQKANFMFRRVITGKEIVFQFVPYNSGPRNIIFDVSGLEKFSKEHPTSCGW